MDGLGAPDPNVKNAFIATSDLPTCTSCGGLLRPDIVWFGESLDEENIKIAEQTSENADLILVIGTVTNRDRLRFEKKEDRDRLSWIKFQATVKTRTTKKISETSLLE